MAEFDVLGTDADFRVRGANWLEALSHTLGHLGMDPDELARLSVDVRAPGHVAVMDPKSGLGFELVRCREEHPTERIPRLADLRSTAYLPEELLPDYDDDDTECEGLPELELDPLEDAPTIAQAIMESAGPEPEAEVASDLSSLEDPLTWMTTRPPLAAQVEIERPADLHEQVFDLSISIASAPGPERACREALRLLMRLIPAESGAVLYAGINDTEMSIAAAFGPVADQLMGLTVDVEEGVAGFCHDTGLGLVIRDVASDRRAKPGVSRKLGYTAQNMLAVGIRDPEELSGNSYGCIELVNAPEGFLEWHLEATQMVAHTLGDFVSRWQ